MKNKYSIISAASVCVALLVGSSAFSQITYTFTNAQATGQNGQPSQAQVNTEYSATNLAGSVTSVNGIQEWTVPSGGLYVIEAFGAQGGSHTSLDGGKGAHILGEFLLTSGQVIEILVGQEGVLGTPGAAGGGGGTYVVDQATGNPLVVAGGGSGSTSSVTGNPGLATEAGDGGDNCTTNGGTNGNGGGDAGSCGNGAGGGGGFFTDGSSASSWGSQRGFGYANGGMGGLSSSGGAVGGFGGGAGTHTNNTGGGAGGGYSGGGAAYHGGAYAGGGGGSYNAGANPVNVADFNTGHGMVVFTQLGSNVPNEAGATGVASPVLGSCAGTYSFDIEVFNFGNNPITSLGVQWSVNGGAVSTQTYTGTIDTVGGPGSPTASINLGNLTISGNTNIRVWTTLPNGQADTVNTNDTVEIEFYASDPQIDLGDLALCDGNFEILSAAGPEWSSYSWSTGSTDPTVIISNPGTYSITVIDTFNCPASDQVDVANGVTPVINMGTNLQACDEAVLNSGTPNGTYIWSSGETTQMITVTESGPYLVTVTSEHGCVGWGGVSVTVNESPVISLGNDKAICVDLGESTVLGVGGGYSSYMWSNGQTGSSIVVNGVQGLPLGQNEFGLTVWDANGCSATDTARVNLKTCTPAGVAGVSNEQGFVMYPNPANDLLTIEFLKATEGATISIVDLRGRTVLSSRLSTSSITSLSLSDIAAGTYNVSVLDDQNNVYIKPIIIQ